MRYTTRGLILAGMLSMLPVVAGARTSARECRSACAPRIEQQCDGRTGRALGRCRRQLRHACRAATPDIGCPSTDDVTRELGDRLLAFSARSFIRLCTDGSFAEPPPVIGGRPGRPLPATPDPTPIVSPGPWVVVVDGDGLALELGAGAARESRLSITRTAAGFLLNGTLVDDTDATAACAAQPSSPSPAQPPPGAGGPVVTLHPHVPRLPEVPQTPELPQR